MEAAIDAAEFAEAERQFQEEQTMECEHRKTWVANSGNGGEPEFRQKRMMHPTEPLMHVRCSACGARTWMTPEQWKQAERIRRRPNPAHGAPKPPGHNPVA